ncbi:unnamed protein product [Agarophyton chilense]
MSAKLNTSQMQSGAQLLNADLCECVKSLLTLNRKKETPGLGTYLDPGCLNPVSQDEGRHSPALTCSPASLFGAGVIKSPVTLDRSPTPAH